MMLPKGAQLVAARWRNELFAEQGWTPDLEQVDVGGEYGGFFVRSPAGLLAYLKPTMPYSGQNPQAANEKIVADLARELDLPVAPVLLHRRCVGGADQESRCCLSLVVLAPKNLLTDLLPNGFPQPEAIPLLRASCGLVAFDTYVDNRDVRNSDRAVYARSADDVPEALVFFDYGLSLNLDNQWRGDGWRSIHPRFIPGPLDVVLDPRVLRDAIDRIEALPDATIERIVERIPDDYMDAAHRAKVVEGLKGRRALIRPVLEEQLQTYT